MEKTRPWCATHHNIYTINGGFILATYLDSQLCYISRRHADIPLCHWPPTTRVICQHWFSFARSVNTKIRVKLQQYCHCILKYFTPIWSGDNLQFYTFPLPARLTQFKLFPLVPDAGMCRLCATRLRSPEAATGLD